MRKIGGKLTENYNPRDTEINSQIESLERPEVRKNWEFGFTVAYNERHLPRLDKTSNRYAALFLTILSLIF